MEKTTTPFPWLHVRTGEERAGQIRHESIVRIPRGKVVPDAATEGRRLVARFP